MEDNSTEQNSTYKKLAVQRLNDPESFRDCASYQVQWWQTVFVSEIQLLVAANDSYD